MPTERVTVYRGDDGGQHDVCWLDLDGVYLWGGFRRETNAQKLAARLNAAMDKSVAVERALCRQVFMRARPSVSLEVSRAEFERLRQEVDAVAVGTLVDVGAR